MISVSPSSQASGRRGSRTHMAVKPHGLANRPGEPYPATFRMQWTHRESNSDLCHARAVSSRWTMSPFRSVDRPGNRTPISWVQARHLPVRRAAHSSEVRPGIEPGLPPYQGGVQPQHLQTAAIAIAMTPDGIEPSLSWMSARCLRRWTTGSRCVTEVGVEPTESRGSRPRRFASLRTRPIK